MPSDPTLPHTPIPITPVFPVPCVPQVPGLFEGDEYATLMTQCKEGAQKEGHMLDTHEELYKWFTSQVIRNLHVVFTMNPSSEGLKDRAATSPALFNRYTRLHTPTTHPRYTPLLLYTPFPNIDVFMAFLCLHGK